MLTEVVAFDHEIVFWRWRCEAWRIGSKNTDWHVATIWDQLFIHDFSQRECPPYLNGIHSEPLMQLAHPCLHMPNHGNLVS